MSSLTTLHWITKTFQLTGSMKSWKPLLIPRRFRLKQTVAVVIAVIFLMVIVTKIEINNSSFARLRHRIALVRTDDDVRLEKSMFSPSVGEYRLENPYKSDFSRGQSKIIDELLEGQANGFFVDIGAGNGESNSVSLYFERERNWHGVLIEANETKYKWSIIKNRQSRIWNFRIILADEISPATDTGIKLDQLFAMINRTVIDLLIIHLNDLELNLIKHIDFVKYNIRVITIELPSDVSNEKSNEITEVLSSHGYKVAHHVINSFQGKKDVIYMKQLLPNFVLTT